MKIIILLILSFVFVSQCTEHVILQGNCNINSSMGTKLFNLTDCQVTVVNEKEFIVNLTFTATRDNVWANRIDNYLGHFKKDGNVFPLSPLGYVAFTPFVYQTGDKISKREVVMIPSGQVSPVGKYLWRPTLCHYPCPADRTFPACSCETMQLSPDIIVDIKAVMYNVRTQDQRTD